MEEILSKIFDKDLIGNLKFTLYRDHLIISGIYKPQYKVVLPKNIDCRIAYLSGVIMGDGSITIAKRKVSGYPQLTLKIFNASEQYLEFLNNEFHGVFGTKGGISKKKDKNCYVLTLNRKLIILYFLKVLEIKGGKKSNLRIPPLLKNKDLFKFFVAGIFDTDGFFTESFGIMMNGSNYNFLKEISLLLEEFYGISSRKLWYGYLNNPRKLISRTQFLIRTRDIDKFINIIPLKHNKYKGSLSSGYD